jgi:hypothetical protein
METFQVIPTADGSPTARLGEGETMHSLRGAFGETVYIYGTALDRATALLADSMADSPRVLSLGLGLGYIEILSAAYSLKNNVGLFGESFELVPELISSFKSWLNEEAVSPMVPFSVYDDILNRTASAVSDSTGLTREAAISTTEIKDRLRSAVLNSDWLLRPALDLETEFTQAFHCVAFDAFSSKSTPELWSREFLDHFLKSACGNACVLSTYACTGHLKRALIDAGFALEIREGYASKRDSTLATREPNPAT